jgi:hypothetical protein
MTLCIAWKYKGTAFLIADAAVTARTNRAPSSPKSTFGEFHKHENGLTVEESAFKLFRWKGLALTCAGDVRPIREFIRLTDDWIKKGLPPWIAIAHARQAQQVETDGTFEAIAATRFLGAVRLFRLDDVGRWHWVPRNTAVNLGNLGPATKVCRDFVNGAIADATRSDQPPAMQLATVLASCQSLTVHNDLLAQGVGGVFSGLMIDQASANWQPDMGYLILNPRDMKCLATESEGGSHDTLYITCAMRDDVLFVSSPEVSGTVAFISAAQKLAYDEIETRVRCSHESARSVRAACRFQYVAVISKTWPQTALVQMHGTPRSADLDLSYENSGSEEKLTVLMSERVGLIVRGEKDEPQRPRVYICLTDPDSPPDPGS